MDLQTRKKIINNVSLIKIVWFVYFFVFYFCSTTEAQVFVPYSFWQGRSPLAIAPSTTQYLLPGDSLLFSASGGNLIYSWAITGPAITDGALMNADVITPVSGTNMDYGARGTTYQNDTVTLTSGASSLSVTVRTYDAIYILPRDLTIAINATVDFGVFNGYCTTIPGACTDATVTWTVFSGGGSVNAAGLFTAPGVAGTSVIQATDNTGHTASVTVTVVSTLTIYTPTISAFAIKLPVYSSANFSAILGTAPMTYSITSGLGSLGCSTTLSGAITNASAAIPVVSTAGCSSSGVVTIGTEQICYSSITGTSFLGTSFDGTTVKRGCNGTTAAAAASGAAVNDNQSVFTAPSTTGTSIVRVTDSLAANSSATVTVIKPVEIKNGYAFSCARFDEGSVKCWGENTNGQLGINSLLTVGDLGTEIGGGNAFVNLGAGRTAVKIAAGSQHACALLDDSTVKCWGDNAYGQIGNGTTTDQKLPALIGFGARTPIDLWAFGYSTCVKFSDNNSVCWGANTSGQAGQGTLLNIISPPISSLNFGSSRYPTVMAGSNCVICALLNDGSVQCWGKNSVDGQLGYGDLINRTAPTGTGVNLGAGRIATDLDGSSTNGITITSEGTFCAVLDDGTVRCWGDNRRGQIGDGSTIDRNVPTPTNTIGFTASKIQVAREFTCAISTTNLVRCWGRNIRGFLAAGDTTDRTGADYCRPTLNAAHTNAVTTITVTSTVGCQAASATGQGKIFINSEIICYTGMSATQFTGATRGCEGTTAAAYSSGTAVLGFNNFGTGVTPSLLSVRGRNACILTTGTSAGRLKCWGIQSNMSGGAVHGLFLYHSTSTSTANNISCIGDDPGEIGDNIPFLNL